MSSLFRRAAHARTWSEHWPLVSSLRPHRKFAVLFVRYVMFSVLIRRLRHYFQQKDWLEILKAFSRNTCPEFFVLCAGSLDAERAVKRSEPCRAAYRQLRNWGSRRGVVAGRSYLPVGVVYVVHNHARLLFFLFKSWGT